MKYCFLNTVYTDKNDNAICYEVVCSDGNFIDAWTEIISFNELQRLSNEEGLETDFCFEEGYLKCNNDVTRVQYHEIAKKDCVKCFDDKIFSLYTLLCLGVENNFSVIEDSIVEENDEWIGNGVVPFNCINYSSSSMSIYAKVVIENEIYNKYLLRIKDGIMYVNQFKFLVPVTYRDDIPDCSFVKKMLVNNEEYYVYESHVKQVLENVQKITPPMINKVCGFSVKLQSTIKLLEELRNDAYKSLGYSKEKLNWVGGNDRANQHSVILKPSSKGVTNVKTVLNEVLALCEDETELKAIQEKISKKYTDYVYRFSAFYVAYVKTESKNSAELLSNVNELLSFLHTIKFYCDTFAYKVRIYAFLTNRSIVTAYKPYYVGSNEPIVTFVKEEV